MKSCNPSKVFFLPSPAYKFKPRKNSSRSQLLTFIKITTADIHFVIIQVVHNLLAPDSEITYTLPNSRQYTHCPALDNTLLPSTKGGIQTSLPTQHAAPIITCPLSDIGNTINHHSHSQYHKPSLPAQHNSISIEDRRSEIIKYWNSSKEKYS